MTLTFMYINGNLLLKSNYYPLERTEMLTNIDYLRKLQKTHFFKFKNTRGLNSYFLRILKCLKRVKP